MNHQVVKSHLGTHLSVVIQFGGHCDMAMVVTFQGHCDSTQSMNPMMMGIHRFWIDTTCMGQWLITQPCETSRLM